MDKSAQIIEYRIVVQSNDVVEASAGDKRDYGELNRQYLNELKVGFLRLLEDSGGKLIGRAMQEGLGWRLYQTLFNGKIEGHFRQNALRLALGNQKVFCRINVVFQKEVAPDIINLPWEFLFEPDEENFLGTHSQFSLSYKYEDWQTLPLSPQHAEKDVRLRVLFVHFHPADLEGIGPIKVRKDIQLLKEAGQAEFHELMNPTVRELHQEIAQYRPHVFHFLTHGRFDHRKGEFALLDSEGETLWYDDQSFGDLFQSWKPQAVVLQACESGKLSESKAFAGPTGSLMRQQVPAVVSMRYPIEQKHAWVFNAAFYRALAANEPIDFAVQKGRHALAISNDAQGHSSHEFAIPTLWMRSEGYILFQHVDGKDESKRLPDKDSLRVLFAHLHPKDLPGIGQIVVRKDVKQLGTVQAEFHELMNPTVRKLHQEIVQYRPHVFHFLIHGRFEHKKGEFSLLDSEGKTLWYDDQSFGDLFQSWQPGLVVLQACESGQLSEIKAVAELAGALTHKQVPAVVSIRHSIQQKDVWAFNAEFYQALAENDPIDLAVQKGRRALAVSNDAQGHSNYDSAIVSLWMRSQSYSLFPTDADQDETASACSVSSSE